MRSLYQKDSVKEVVNRLEALQPGSQRPWGKMEVAQMLAHCSEALEVASGNKFPPRLFLGKVIGFLFKPVFLNEKPLRKNAPTDKSLIITNKREFLKEKARLINLINQFSAGGQEKCTSHPHSLFGKLTPEEWGIGMYKHLDHHLRQYNV